MTSQARIAYQKEVAIDLLKQLELLYPYTILAGGAPRDWYVGRAAKDLDFFLYYPHTYAHLDKMLRRIGWVDGTSKAKWGDNIPMEYKLNPDIRCVIDGKWMDQDVQLIILKKDTFGIVEKFPINLCQCWWKGQDSVKRYYGADFVEEPNGVILTRSAYRGFKYKSVVKVNELYAEGHAYLKKIREKFPDFCYYNSEQQFIDSLV